MMHPNSHNTYSFHWGWITICLLFVAGWAEGCRAPLPSPVAIRETTVYRDTTIYVPGGIIADTIHCTDIERIPVDVYHISVDSSGRAELKWWKDRYGQLQIRCTAKDTAVVVQKVYVDRKVVTTLPAAPTKPVRKTNWEALAWGGIIFGIILCITIVALKWSNPAGMAAGGIFSFIKRIFA